MFKSLINSIDEPWIELKQIFLGGGPIPNEIIDVVREKNWPVSIVYGSTETASMVAICSTPNLIANGISAGVPMEGVKIKIDNFSKSKFIFIQSRSIAKSYYKSDGEFVHKLIDGGFTSNDIGEIDKNGNLQVLGRGDEIIISGGENISLIQIRKIISEKFVGLDFVNFGIKDEKWEQSYITVIGSEKPEIEEKLEKYLSEQLPKFKLPKHIYKLESLPRNELGKINKKEIQKMLNVDFL
jgi:O-succinylbenzoic acid--CoA ligase